MIHRGPLALIPVMAFFLAERAAGPSLAPYAMVDVTPMHASAYTAGISLSAGRFQRQNGSYAGTYSVKVVPYFFFNEQGRMKIDISDAALRQVARGSAIEFTGTAVRSDDRERLLTGRVIPIDATSGKIKVRVIVSKRIILVFNTTYHLAGPPD